MQLEAREVESETVNSETCVRISRVGRCQDSLAGLRAKREQLKRSEGLESESQGQNMAVTVLYVPYSLSGGSGCEHL